MSWQLRAARQHVSCVLADRNADSASTFGAEVDVVVSAKFRRLGVTPVLNGRSAVVTGSTSGIRLGIARALVLTPLVEAQIEGRAERENISFDQAKMGLLAQKQPSRERRRANTRAALPIDGGWTSQ